MRTGLAIQGRHQQSLSDALGSSLLSHLADPDVIELMLNPDGSLWLDRHSSGLEPIKVSLQPAQVEALLTTVAGILGEELTHGKPVLEGELPFDGSRITAMLPPVVPAPSFAIRKRAAAIYRLRDYVDSGILDRQTALILSASVAPSNPSQRPRNVVLAGGPGSGKTTLANALLAEIAEAVGATQRLVLIEDTYELQCAAECQVTFHTTEQLDLRYMVRRAMRYRPDRIIVGEVRGAEALDLLKAWNTGTPGGLATVHANSAVDALDRLDHLAQEAGVRSAQRLVASTVDTVAFITRTAQGRRVTELRGVRGLTCDGDYDTFDLLEERS